MGARKTETTILESGAAAPDDIDGLITGTLGDGANYKIEVSRVSGQSGTAGAFLDAITPDELPDIKQRVRDEYGSGTYLVRVLKNGRYHSQARFSVEGRAKPGGAAPAARETPAQPNQDGLLATVIERMMQRMEDSQKAIIAELTNLRQRPAGGDPFEQFKQIAAIIKETRADAPQIGAQQLMEVWKQGVEAAKSTLEIAAPAGGKSLGGIYEFAARFFESPMGAALGQGIAQIATMRPPGAPGAPIGGMAPQPQPGAPAQAPRQLPPAVSQDENGLGQAITYLVNRAANNSSPELQAEWLFDLMSEEGRQWLINTPNILDLLVAQFPDVAPHRAWFAQLLEEIRKLAQDVANQPEGAEVESGNTADAVSAGP